MKAVISLSGGMDSTCLLVHLMAKGYEVYGVSFDYGQKHAIEIERLRANLEYLQLKGCKIAEWKLIDIHEISDLFESHLLKSGNEIPEGHYEQDNMKQTVVPNRNAIFSSIVYGYALSIANRTNEMVRIFLGVHSGDHAIYPDCRPEFFASLGKAFKKGNWNGDMVNFVLPYLHFDKTYILKDCLANCEATGLDFDTILRNTNTSYNPDEQGRSSGTSGADIERIEAFINIDRVDPVSYVQPWEIIRENALKILENANNNQKDNV